MKTFLYIIIISIMFSCEKSDCNSYKPAFYPDEYYLIAKEINIDEVWIKIEGSAPVTNEKESIMVHNNWIVNSNEVERGDTIVKKKGELALYIHKKNAIIMHDWYCNGSPYK
ncbi:hypothetical protein [Chryseobacterium sp. ISL-6]|uniref:hypothetical protein n=1 Tax=Chryseobacterium sp. ISL-6 TaxID=2819143 RepID=UPI001BE85C34|nr:hypothetical protein [Chryseobacterium sp. ISL-6]MBT2623523.1 hypothetical protein [Chryseobacterium sp. ISL-6]